MPALGGVRRVLRLVRTGRPAHVPWSRRHGRDRRGRLAAGTAGPVRTPGRRGRRRARCAGPPVVRAARTASVSNATASSRSDSCPRYSKRTEQGAAEVRRPAGTTGGTRAGAGDRLPVQRDGLVEVVPAARSGRDAPPACRRAGRAGAADRCGWPLEVATARRAVPTAASSRSGSPSIRYRACDRRRQVRQAQRQVGRVGSREAHGLVEGVARPGEHGLASRPVQLPVHPAEIVEVARALRPRRIRVGDGGLVQHDGLAQGRDRRLSRPPDPGGPAPGCPATNARSSPPSSRAAAARRTATERSSRARSPSRS